MTGFVALIPARLASSRLPGKALADLAGQPMVVRVAEQARRSGAHLVAVATDAPSIAQAVERFGFKAVLTRADHVSGTDRLAEAAAALNLADDELVVNVQGDEPLIPPPLIAEVAACLAAAPECSMATAAHRIDTIDDYLSPHVVKVVLDARGRAAYFSRAPIPFDRDGLAPGMSARALSVDLHNAGLPLRHIGIYAYRAGFLKAYPGLGRSPLEALESLEQLRALWHGHSIAVRLTDAAPPPGVDTQADLDRVRAALRQG